VVKLLTLGPHDTGAKLCRHQHKRLRDNRLAF